eukprot:2652646-Rhodomonas_salina.1
MIGRALEGLTEEDMANSTRIDVCTHSRLCLVCVGYPFRSVSRSVSVALPSASHPARASEIRESVLESLVQEQVRAFEASHGNLSWEEAGESDDEMEDEDEEQEDEKEDEKEERKRKGGVSVMEGLAELLGEDVEDVEEGEGRPVVDCVDDDVGGGRGGGRRDRGRGACDDDDDGDNDYVDDEDDDDDDGDDGDDDDNARTRVDVNDHVLFPSLLLLLSWMLSSSSSPSSSS